MLIGGTTRIPSVCEKINEITGQVPCKSLNPDECVALGASIQGGKLMGYASTSELLLLDVTSLTLSIEIAGGAVTPLIERNTTIPAKGLSLIHI